MSGYFFSEASEQKPKSLYEIAKDNVLTYTQNRKKFVQEIINYHIKTINETVLMESRKNGKTSITYNYTTNKIESKINKEMFPDSQFSDLTKEEHDLILENLMKYLDQEDLKYERPENSFNSIYYRANLTIVWC